MTILVVIVSGVTIIALLGIGMTAMSPGVRGLWKALIAGRNERLADEQEHRQRLERDRLRHAQKLAEAEKLREVLQVTIADRAMGDVLREEIDRLHPQVRVEPIEDRPVLPSDASFDNPLYLGLDEAVEAQMRRKQRRK